MAIRYNNLGLASDHFSATIVGGVTVYDLTASTETT
jgi:hypothetical protein